MKTPSTVAGGDQSVSPMDRYLYDVRGYLVLRGALSADEVATFNRHLDSLRPESIDDVDARDRAMAWLFDLHTDFARLMDHPAVLPYLRAFVDTKVRIDGAYALVKRPGEGVPLHARSVSPREGTGWYHVHRGEITSGLTAVEWALSDIPSGRGGLCCVPGSHKANFEVPLDELNDHAEDISVRAGDAVIFTEALTHGSRWHGPGARRVLIYKYCPGTVAWISDVWTEEMRAGMTDRQRRMTIPPYTYDATAKHDREEI